jgi:hypothetical protein
MDKLVLSKLEFEINRVSDSYTKEILNLINQPVYPERFGCFGKFNAASEDCSACSQHKDCKDSTAHKHPDSRPLCHVCGGTKKVNDTVILGVMYEKPCPNCKDGYEPSRMERISDEEIIEATKVNMYDKNGKLDTMNGYLTGRQQVAQKQLLADQKFFDKAMAEKDKEIAELDRQYKEYIGLAVRRDKSKDEEIAELKKEITRKNETNKYLAKELIDETHSHVITLGQVLQLQSQRK